VSSHALLRDVCFGEYNFTFTGVSVAHQGLLREAIYEWGKWRRDDQNHKESPGDGFLPLSERTLLYNIA
jgi:hypothetical protein